MAPRASPVAPQHILLPVKVSTMVASFAIALLLSFLPWPNILLVPDFVALVLVFWCVHQSRMVGLAVGWTLGLLIDAGNGVLLGQHALSYSLLAFASISLARRILWFGLARQALHVAALLTFAEAVAVVVRLAAGADFPGWQVLVGPLAGAALWPVASFLLLLPQRRPVEVDETRPI